MAKITYSPQAGRRNESEVISSEIARKVLSDLISDKASPDTKVYAIRYLNNYFDTVDLMVEAIDDLQNKVNELKK